MKKRIFRLLHAGLLVFFFSSAFAHEAHQKGHEHYKTWSIISTGEQVDATFLMYKNAQIYLEKTDHTVVHFPLSAFSEADRAMLQLKIDQIEKLNSETPTLHLAAADDQKGLPWHYFFMLLLTLVSTIVLIKKRSFRFISAFVLIISLTGLYSFRSGLAATIAGTDPAFLDMAFAPFKPFVHTFWDENYFYVESKGIADHEMMTGIRSWQQQVPIPQCYIGNNAWSIPLNPVLADVPVPVSPQHFLRGAVAVAANGIPIFNPYTNTGVDALVDGQLDDFGGHSGRADDYHYHIAPLHLDTITSAVLPIAFALDGFAIYGPLEPDGSVMKPLDTNHGHFGQDGVYHYHGTKEAPYMIGKMVGKVTEDNTLQIVPQASAKPVRPSLTPLNGATITDCTPNSTGNGYDLTYTRNGQTYMVNYFWTNNGKYTYNFIGPNGTTTSVYNGFAQCSVPTSIEEEATYSSFRIFPNPTDQTLQLDPGMYKDKAGVTKISIFDDSGKLRFQSNEFIENIDVNGLSPGLYIVHIQGEGFSVSKKVIIY